MSAGQIVRAAVVLLAAAVALASPIAATPAMAQTTVGGSGSDSTYSTNVTSGSLTKIGANTVTLTGSNTYAGGTFINAGTLQFATAGNIGTSDVTLNGGTAAYAGVTGTITRQMPVTANSGFTVTSGSTLTWLGNLNGNGKLTLTGPGTLVLGGSYDNSVNGIRVESGTLRAAHTTNYFLLGYLRGTGGNIDSSPLEIGANGTVQVEASDNFPGGVTQYATTTYANTPVQIESGLMTFVDPGTGTRNNTIGKFTFVNGGTLDIQTRNRVDLNSLGGIVSSGTGATTISGGGTLNIVKRASGDTPTIDVATAAPLTISAVLDSTSQGNSTGGLGITKTGSGTLILTAANSYGATTITAGVIQVGNGGTSGSLGAGGVTNSAALVFNRGGSLTVSNAISGSGSVTNTGTGTVTLSGNNSFSGGTTITSGAIQVGSNTAFGTGAVVNNSQISMNSGSDFTVANAISGTGLISKAGAGTLTLSGTSSFSGGVTIAAGGVSVPHGSSLGSGTVRFTAPASFTVTGTSVTLGNPFDLGSVSGTVSLIVPSPSSTVINGPITGGIVGTTLFFNNATASNGGALTLNGTNSFQGTLFVNRGPVVLGNASAAGASSITLFANNNALGDLQFGAGGFTIPNNVQLSNAGVGNWIGVPAGQTNGISGVISGNGFTKIGGGTLVLAADNSYSGGTTFTSGTVQVGNGGAAGSLGSGAVSNGGAIVFNRGGSVTVAGAISGTGLLTQAGPGATVLTGGNTYTGATSISSGTLQVGSGGSGSTLGGSGAITNNGSLVFNIGDSQTLARSIVGSGGLTKAGDGTLTLGGTNTHSGGTMISGGELAVSGTANVGAGPIAFTASATLNVTATSAATFGNTLSIAPSGTSTLLKRSPGALDYAGSIGGGGTGATLFFQTSNLDTSTTFTLSGSNSFRGTMNLNRGNLIVANVNALGDPANLLYVNQYVDTTAGNVRFAVSGTFANPVQLVLSPSSIETGTTDVVLTGSISGNGLYKLGGGRLTLAGTAANSYTTTTIASGTLQVGLGAAGGSLGTGNVTNNGSLLFNRTGSLTVAGAISGTGSLTQAGSGATVLTGGNTYTGATTISSGTLQVGNGGSGSTLGGAGTITNDGSLAFNIGDGQTIPRSIVGIGELTKAGNGTLTLGGTNTYSGGTTISGGELSIAGTSSIGSGQIRFTAPSTLALTSSTVTFNNAFDLGSTSGTITLMVSTTSSTVINGPITGGRAGTTIMFNNPVGGANTGVLTLNGTNSFQGNLLVYRGPLVLGNGAAAGGSTIQLEGNNNPLGDLQFGSGGFTIPNGVQLLNSGGLLGNWIGVPAGQTNGISGVISGNGFTKIGAGTLVLAADNSYSGGTTFTSGTVQVGDGGAAGSVGSGNVANGGALVFNRSGTVTVPGAISGTGSLLHLGSGTTVLAGNNSYTGGTTLAGGFLNVGSSNAIGSSGTISFTGGTLQYSGSNATDYSSRFSTSAGQQYSIDTNGQNVTLASNLTSVGGSLAKLGSGTLTLSGTNSYSGGTVVSAGRLVGTAASLQGTITNDAALEFAQATTGTFSGSIGGSGTLDKSGIGSLTLTGSSSFTGNTALTAGTLVLSNARALGASSVLAMQPGTTLTVNQRTYVGDVDQFGGTINGPGELVATLVRTESGSISAVIADDGAFARGLRKLGSGTTTVTSANTFTGSTRVEAGRLVLGTGGSFAAASSLETFSGGTLDLAGNSQTFGSISGTAGSIALGAGTLTVNNAGSNTFGGVITGSGGLVKSAVGNLILAGTSSYSGPTSVSAGRLSVNGVLGNTAVTVQSGAELGGEGSIVGSLAILSGGTLSPGNSIASLSGGATSFASGATFGYEVDSSLLGSLGTAADLLVVSGNLDIASGALLSFADITSGTVQPFVEDTTIFAMINYSGAWNGGLFTYNGNELADGERFMVGSQQWEIDYNLTSPTGLSNFTGDYLPSSSFVAITAVPEPGTLVLAGVALLWLACGKRMQRS